MDPFRTRLRVSLEAGILLGVKYGAALILIGLALAWLATDYQQTKVNALKGAQAYLTIEQARANAQKAQQTQPPAVKP